MPTREQIRTSGIHMKFSTRTPALRLLLACTMVAICTPAMSENFLDKLKKATDTLERSRDSAKRTVDDVNDLGSSGKSKKGKSPSAGNTGDSESTTMNTSNAGEANLSEGPSAELREQVGRMGGACRERSAEGASFSSCAQTCSAAADRISSSAKGSANDEAHASCQAKYNQAMGMAPAPAGTSAVVESAPPKVESGQSPMPGG
jgi:hypothetical protein